MEGVYRRGMQEEVLLEAGVVHTIFPCLDQLLELHTNFLSQLLSRRKDGLQEGSANNFTVRRLGDLLLRQVSSPVATKWVGGSWSLDRTRQNLAGSGVRNQLNKIFYSHTKSIKRLAAHLRRHNMKPD